MKTKNETQPWGECAPLELWKWTSPSQKKIEFSWIDNELKSKVLSDPREAKQNPSDGDERHERRGGWQKTMSGLLDPRAVNKSGNGEEKNENSRLLGLRLNLSRECALINHYFQARGWNGGTRCTANDRSTRRRFVGTAHGLCKRRTV